MRTVRSASALEHHYEVELRLAEQLRAAEPGMRASAYKAAYDELFRSVPDHPQLAVEPAARARSVAGRLRFVRRFCDPSSTLLEIGTGDGAFARAAAPVVARVLAVDVSEEIVRLADLPANVEVHLVDGVRLPFADASVHVAFSDQLMEHLAPDDALAQLSEIRRVLAPGGVYVCITPNRTTGPHDISALHDEVARGFHLREYDSSELASLMGAAGFGSVRFYAGGAGRYVELPPVLLRRLERLAGAAPRTARRRFGESLPAYVLLGLNVVASVK